jgi:hypothetical protein
MRQLLTLAGEAKQGEAKQGEAKQGVAALNLLSGSAPDFACRPIA